MVLLLLAGCALVPRAWTLLVSGGGQNGPQNPSVRGSIKKNQASSSSNTIAMMRSRSRAKRRNHTAADASTLSFGAFDVVELPMNPESTLSNDIRKIEHLPAFSRIDLHFRAGARCPRPYLLGRLSGPSLVLIHDWRWNPVRNPVDNSTKTVMTGQYQVPVSGQYNVEVIVIHCDDSMHNMRQHGVDVVEGQSAMMNIDKHVCIEDPFNHRLTEQGATIMVDHTVATIMQPTSAASKAGFWRRPSGDYSPSSPLLTRFQSPKSHVWGSPTNANTMVEYVHDRDRKSIGDTKSKKDLAHADGAKICVLGSSTSHQNPQQLATRIRSYIGHSAPQVNVSLTWSIVESPNHVTKEYAQSFVESHQCEKIVITGVPPWRETVDADPTGDGNYWDGIHSMIRQVQAPTYQIARYREAMDGMLRNFVSLRGSMGKGIGAPEVYLIPLPYRPLDIRMTACPPMDWRSPPVIDGYNVAIAEACEELGGAKNNVTFLDTRPIVDPMWDSVDDWGTNLDHDGTALTVEAQYIANYVLGLLKPAERSVVIGLGT